MPRGAARPAIDPGGEDAGDERPVGRPIPRHHGTPGGLFVDEFLRFHEAYICLLKSRYTPKLAVKAHPSSRRKPGPKNSAECRDGRSEERRVGKECVSTCRSRC